MKQIQFYNSLDRECSEQLSGATGQIAGSKLCGLGRKFHGRLAPKLDDKLSSHLLVANYLQAYEQLHKELEEK